jgi:hypothetical protein
MLEDLKKYLICKSKIGVLLLEVRLPKITNSVLKLNSCKTCQAFSEPDESAKIIHDWSQATGE